MSRILITILALVTAVPAVAAEPTGAVHDDWRMTPKLLFSPEFEARGASDPTSIARAFVDTHLELLGAPSAPDDLRRVGERRSLTATHVRFQQLLEGIPVEGAEVVVSVADDLRIRRVFNNLFPVLDPPIERAPRIGTADAVDIAWAHLRVHGELLDAPPSAQLVWQPAGVGFRLVYRTVIGVEAPFGRWEVRVDARTGEILATRRTELPRRTTGKVDFEVWSGPLTDRHEAEARFEAAHAADPGGDADERRETGSGEVFDPDPRTTLNDGSLVDSSPASAFTAAYQTAQLLDILKDGATYRLLGPWVEILDFESPSTAPSTTGDGVWTATRGANAFNDVMTYFHIDQNQRYMQSLGFDGATGIQQGPIGADSDGLSGSDNSHYIPGSNRLAFGHGCVDDNEDADVILHEYGHAIQHDINPSWGGGDSGGMGEGFGDYWAGSYSYVQPGGDTFHPEWVFTWDGHSSCWPGRVMNALGAQYDPSQTYGAHQTVSGVLADELWSTPLFSSLVELIGLGHPRTEVDAIVLESHFGLGSGLRMPDMAQSTVDAAAALFPAGPHANVFQSNFADHNILALPPIPAFTIVAPSAGATLPPGASTDVSWTTAGAPADTLYTAAFTDMCTPVVAFFDDMENDGSGWSATHGSGGVDWSLGTASPHSGAKAWFAADIAGVTDQYLTTAAPIAVSGSAELRFWHAYDTESGFDGGVVEISTDGGGSWDDLGDAMTANGYSGSISTSFSSPIGGRDAFTGGTGVYLETVADLSAYSGTSALFRFRMATDSSVAGNGWYVDDVGVLTAGEWVAIGVSSPGASSMSWTVPAVPGDDYCVRVTGEASGHTSAAAVSDPFSVESLDVIFSDGFESGDGSAWSDAP